MRDRDITACFKARGLRSIPTSTMVALTVFFHADAEKNFHLLPVSFWHLSNFRLGLPT